MSEHRYVAVPLEGQEIAHAWQAGMWTVNTPHGWSAFKKMGVPAFTEEQAKEIAAALNEAFHQGQLARSGEFRQLLGMHP